MALDLSLRRWLWLPRFIQTGDEEPRREHYIRRSDDSFGEKADSGTENESPPPKPSTGKYRSLSDFTLGEVEEALAWFRPQLVQPPSTEWIAKNYFCEIPLQRSFEQRPPVIFGRIKSCYPATGDLENIEEMELLFPRKQAAPDLLHINYGDVSQRRPIQSYCLGVKMYLSEAEQRDFSHSENIFIEKGFAPLYEAGYGDLLQDVHEQNRAQLFWVYVFGSEWFATIPDSMQLEVKDKLLSLVRWNRTVLNYHPKRYTLQYRSLNDELDFQYDFSEHYLVMPHDVGQVLTKVEQKFEERFVLGM